MPSGEGSDLEYLLSCSSLSLQVQLNSQLSKLSRCSDAHTVPGAGHAANKEKWVSATAIQYFYYFIYKALCPLGVFGTDSSGISLGLWSAAFVTMLINSVLVCETEGRAVPAGVSPKEQFSVAPADSSKPSGAGALK